MQSNHLEALKLIIELGSFTRAAEAMNVSQPAISKMISLLERECGFVLFKRVRNETLPTPEASMLYVEAERMLVGIRAVRERARAIASLQSGHLEIFAFPAFAARVLPQLICVFNGQRTDIKYSLASRDAATFVNKSLSLDMDIGFSAVGGDRLGLTSELFTKIEAVCLLPPGHRLTDKEVVTPADLVGERFIKLVGEPQFEATFQDVFDRIGGFPEFVAEVRMSDAAYSLVANGFGVTIADPLVVYPAHRTNIVVKRFEPTLFFDVWLLRPNYRPHSNLADAFVEHVAQSLPDIIGTIVPPKIGGGHS